MTTRSTMAAAVATLLLAAVRPGQAQRSLPDSARSSGPRAVRLVASGGLAVPTGGFATYHELGVQASGSLLVRLMGQKLRLRPEVAYTQFQVAEAKVRALVSSLTAQQLPAAAYRSTAIAELHRMSRPAGAGQGALPRVAAGDLKLPDLEKLGTSAVSSLLGAFANLELPLGPGGFQPYLIGGVGAVTFRTDVTTVGEALDGVQWALNAGVGLRFKLGPIGGGVEARFRGIPVDEAKTFFSKVTAVPVSFSLIF